MNITSYVYIVTRRKGESIDILSAHRRLEFARKELDEMRDEARTQGCRTISTQAGCCLRIQKGESVVYYEINKQELK